MSIHWRELTTDGKIEAIKAVYEPGMSAKEIAESIGGIGRNVVCGIFFRHGPKLEGFPLRAYRTGPTRPAKKPKVRSDKFSFGAFDIKKAKVAKAELASTQPAHMCGRPLVDLKGSQCRWPVNEADVGELHLFCGAPADRSYCEHHTARSYRPRETQPGPSRRPSP